MNAIIGRELELRFIDSLMTGNRSQFIAVYGRRRVEKTFLVRNAFNENFDFYLTGLANANTSQQLTNFHTVLLKYKKKGSALNLAYTLFNTFHP